jgi:hypothetical protein
MVEARATDDLHGLDEDEHIAPGSVRVRSVELATDEEREAQAEVFQQFSRDVRGNSPKASNSEDEEPSIPPDVDSDSGVHIMTGDGFVITPEYDGQKWANLSSFADVLRAQRAQRKLDAITPDWMSESDKNRMFIEGKRPVRRDKFCDAARLAGRKEFAILEQRRFEECRVIPGPENDAIVGSALVVWSPSFISVLKSFGKEDYPIVVTGMASEHVFRNLLTQSRILLIPERPEGLEALKRQVISCRTIGTVRRIAISRSGRDSSRCRCPARMTFKHERSTKRRITSASR